MNPSCFSVLKRQTAPGEQDLDPGVIFTPVSADAAALQLPLSVCVPAALFSAPRVWVGPRE